MSAGWPDDYAGDVTATEAFDLLRREPKGQLVDVRTKAEWSFVGVADLGSLDREPILMEWQRYPAMEAVPDFAAQLTRELERRGVGRGDPLLFLCRSGARSLSAAKAMTQAGWCDCRNIAGGFEGPLDPERHRGGRDGWKAAGLPWVQS